MRGHNICFRWEIRKKNLLIILNTPSYLELSQMCVYIPWSDCVRVYAAMDVRSSLDWFCQFVAQIIKIAQLSLLYITTTTTSNI